MSRLRRYGRRAGKGSERYLEEVLEECRAILNAALPGYAASATIMIIPDSNAYLQPRTDYEVFVMMDEPEHGALERIVHALPIRFEKNGTIYTVHVESTQEHLERHVDGLSG